METERTHLDPRLLAAAEFVRPGSVAADIGCDHGKLSIYLAKSGRCPKVIAADLRPEPLARARVNLTNAHCQEQVELRLGDGLTVLQPGEAQDIIIAGMGAETIMQVVAAAPWVRQESVNLVLVPATKHSLLRKWLAENGFSLRGDRLVEAAGRLYAVMNARYTGKAIQPDGRWCVLGETGGELQKRYLAAQLGKIYKYRRGLKDPAELEQLDRLIQELEETYGNL